MSLDVGIVGGGVIGWSTAWHLMQTAPTLQVAVFDNDPAAERCSSVRGTGGFRTQFGSGANIQLSLLSLPEFLRFDVLTGTDLHFRQNGYLFVTRDLARLSHLAALRKTQTAVGVRVEPIGAEQIVSRSLGIDGYLGGNFGPRDGVFDGPGVLQGYRRAAINLGVRAIFGRNVAVQDGAILCDGDRHAAAVTVLGAGHWSQSLATEIGIDLPIEPSLHQLTWLRPTTPVWPSLPMVVDVDSTFHFREKSGGLLFGYDDPLINASIDPLLTAPSADPNTEARVLELVRRNLAHLQWDPNSVKSWAGWYSNTPDDVPILDRIEDTVLAVGFGGHGVMHAPAAGKLAAELAIDGAMSHADAALFALHRPFDQRQETNILLL